MASDQEELPAMGEGEAPLTRTLKDLGAGAAGGVAQVLLGQPFDIVKVRLQTTSEYPNALACARSIFQHEGPAAFYKGTLTPLLGIGACVSIQFGAFHSARRYFESTNLAASRPSALTSSQTYLAGAFAGISNAVLSTPIEHVRIRLQTQPHAAARRLYRGPLDCARQLIRHGGGILPGLYRGGLVTVLREAQAYGVWFWAFEALMAAEVARGPAQRTRADVPAWKVAAYGGLAGEALWAASYPLDVVKSKLQSDGLGAASRYTGTWDCVRKTWTAEGWRGFWKGIGPTLVRAMPVSAGTFAVVEMTMRALG